MFAVFRKTLYRFSLVTKSLLWLNNAIIFYFIIDFKAMQFSIIYIQYIHYYLYTKNGNQFKLGDKCSFISVAGAEIHILPDQNFHHNLHFMLASQKSTTLNRQYLNVFGSDEFGDFNFIISSPRL